MYEKIKEEIKKKLLENEGITLKPRETIIKTFEKYNIETIPVGSYKEAKNKMKSASNIHYKKDKSFLARIYFDVKENKYYKITDIVFDEKFHEIYGELNEGKE